MLTASSGLSRHAPSFGVNRTLKPFALSDVTAAVALDLDFSDLTKLYQDSALTTPVASDSDPVGGWKDGSGNNAHFIQATAGKRPLYKAGLGVRFDGTDDSLGITGFSGLNASTDRTVFLVAKNAASVGGVKVAFGNGTTNFWVGGNATDLSYTSFAKSAGTQQTTLSAGAFWDTAAYHVYAFCFSVSGGVGTVTHWRDGTVQRTQNYSGGAALPTATGWTLGAWTSASSFFDLTIKRVRIYPSLLSDTQITRLTTYFRNLYDF